MGVLTAIGIGAIGKGARVKEDTAIGIIVLALPYQYLPLAGYPANAHNARKDKDEKEHLSRIIDVLNERLGTDEFTEADGVLYTSSLIELGLILFVITFIVLAFARLLLMRINAKVGS